MTEMAAIVCVTINAKETIGCGPGDCGPMGN